MLYTNDACQIYRFQILNLKNDIKIFQLTRLSSINLPCSAISPGLSPGGKKGKYGFSSALKDSSEHLKRLQ